METPNKVPLGLGNLNINLPSEVATSPTSQGGAPYSAMQQGGQRALLHRLPSWQTLKAGSHLILYCIRLYYIISYHNIYVYCIVLYYIKPYFTMLYYIMLCYGCGCIDCFSGRLELRFGEWGRIVRVRILAFRDVTRTLFLTDTIFSADTKGPPRWQWPLQSSCPNFCHRSE